jgi:hypothetical protein
VSPREMAQYTLEVEQWRRTLRRRERVRLAAFALGIGALVVLLMSLSGCAMPEPVVDPTSIGNEHQYKSDLFDCQTLAYKAVPDPMAELLVGALVGAAAGAAGGAAGGAFFGNAGQGAEIGAAIGAPIVGGASAGDAQSTRKQIVGNCMAHRGYAVLAVQ